MPSVEQHYGAYLIHGRAWGRRGTLVQTDWEFPATARALGWNMRRVQPDPKGADTGRVARFLRHAPPRGKGCDHRGTDGTVTCPGCGLYAENFIEGATIFLDSLC